MTCESARNLVEPYLDGELDASLGSQVQEHLTTCEACAQEHAKLIGLRDQIGSQAPYYRAPAHLGDRIGMALRQEGRRPARTWQWLAVAASLLLGVSLAWNIAQLARRPSANDSIAQNLMASHIRSLMGTHLLDVPSSDRHTVKPWFNGKLDFSPDVKDFATQGFPLLGGRLDYAEGHPVAALVYQRRQHLINLFIWPSGNAGGGSEVSHNGYHALHWSRGGMAYWAISDVATEELQQLARLYQNP